jgi:hypothetical protein
MQQGRTADAGGADADALVEAAVAAAAAGDAAPHLDALVRRGRTGDGARAVDRALGRVLVDGLAGAWRRGWQPADLHRVIERRAGRRHARLAAEAIGREAQRHPVRALPPRWRLQLDAIGAADRSRSTGDGWVLVAAAGGRGEQWLRRAVEVAVATAALVRSLPSLPLLGPVPGEPGATVAPGTGAAWPVEAVGVDPRVLRRVTALLAKAESTTFPDEAEALTAKAQQLMTRHALDRALLDAHRGSGARVAARRIGIDDPYARARFLLLAAVAEANRCRAVWTRRWWFATVFGDEADLDAVELLFTSLLVQATRAMVAERPPARSPGATRSFRQSFLVAFAGRIAERLARAAEDEVARRGDGAGALVPLLQARREAAEAALRAAFPEVRTTRVTARDPAGWAAGVRAADRAQLDGSRTLADRDPGQLGR